MTISEWKLDSDFKPNDYDTIVREWTASVDFGLVDTKGRRLGCVVFIEERAGRAEEVREGYSIYPKMEPGFYTGIQSMRDGHAFGASAPRTVRFETLAGAQASLLKRAEQSRKRQLKQFPNQPEVK